ncbi:MAG: PDZ domain-containing protein [Planctomycetes bacterium]|nr:PDZ domain-containing protein [Planctomycetota bacterium]
MRTWLACLPSLLLTVACSSVPVGSIPDPLPEALAWEVPASGDAFLGLETEENASGSLLDLSFDPGARVLSVVRNSPAEKAGFRQGDVVLAVDGAAVEDPDALDALVAARRPGDETTISVRRLDTVFDVTLALAGGRDPGTQVELAYRVDRSRSLASWAAAPDGVRLVASHPDGPLARADVPVGSVVTAIDGEPVHGDRALLRRFAAHVPGDEVVLDVRRPDATQVVPVEIELAEPPTRVTGWNALFLASWDAEPDGSRARFSLLDLWVFELLQYQRDRRETRWVLFELFGFDLLSWATGEGELGT